MYRSRLAIAAAVSATLVAIPAALAIGASPTPPSVTSAPATNVTGSGATVNGMVNPNGQSTSYAFQWGPTTGYGHETPLASAGSGTTAAPVSASLSGLASGTTYHFRVIALSGGETSVGSAESFTTTGSPPAPSPPPSATTGSATNGGGAGARLTGTVNPGGQATSYYFEYGPTSDYGYETSAQSAGSGTTNVPVTADASGLSSSTSYHYRLVAVSAGGTALGADQTFKTTATPVVVTAGPSNVDATSAVLNGFVNPEGQPTTYFFQYGLTTAYGTQSASASAGSGGANVAVKALAGGLRPNNTYHYRLVATNPSGTSYGADGTVVLGQVSHVVFLGREGFVSPGRVIGVEAGCFGGVTRCTGQVALRHNGVVIGHRAFDIAADSGGFQNMQITPRGQRMLLGYNRVFHLLPVTVTVTSSGGQKTSQVIHLARWVWH